MTKKPNTTEKMLETGKGISLSASEHEELRSNLRAYAEYHGLDQTVKTTKKPQWYSLLKTRPFAVTSLVLVLLVGTGYVSTDSLPGETFYGIKVNVMEEIIAMTKTSPTTQLQYQQERFEKRLTELQALQITSTTSDALSELHTELEELSNETALLLTDDINTNEQTLDFIGDIIAITNAAEMIVRPSADTQIAEDFEAVVDDMEKVRNDQINTFTENATSTVEEYTRSQIDRLEQDLKITTVASSSLERIELQISDAETSLQVGDYEDAIMSVSNAQQTINTQALLQDHIPGESP